jgi:hypothetical protein
MYVVIKNIKGKIQSTVFTHVLAPPVYYPHPNFESLFQKKKNSDVFKNPKPDIPKMLRCLTFGTVVYYVAQIGSPGF